MLPGSHRSGRFDFQLSTVNVLLGAVTGVDADVFRGEIAGPIARDGAACVQVQHDVDVRREEPIAGGALVEINGLAAAQDVDAGHGDVHAIGVELYPGAPGSGEDATPVGVAARERGLHQR